MTEQPNVSGDEVQQDNGRQEVRVSGQAMTLTVVLTIGWAICFWPARLLNPETGVLWMTIAAICCLIPGWVVVFLSGLAIFPNELAAMLVQTMVRMSSVAGAAVVVRKLYPHIGVADFFGWLIGFYLLALTIEVTLLLPKTRVSNAK